MDCGNAAESVFESIHNPVQRGHKQPYYCDVCNRLLGDSKPHNIQEHKGSTRHLKRLEAAKKLLEARRKAEQQKREQKRIDSFFRPVVCQLQS